MRYVLAVMMGLGWGWAVWTGAHAIPLDYLCYALAAGAGFDRARHFLRDDPRRPRTF